MGRFVAIGGGTFEETDGLVRRIVHLSGKQQPNILFIGTAEQDSTNPLTSVKKSFKRVCPGVVVKKLSIIRNTYTDEEIDVLLKEADVIYVGPGNTEFMLEKWAERGISEKLRGIFDRDQAVLCGLSAGAICWFSVGYTDSDAFKGLSEWSYRMIEPGINLFDATFCPHFGDYGRRGFLEEVKQYDQDGIGLEDCTAFIYDNGKVSFASSKEGAKAYLFRKENQFLKEEVPMEDCIL